MKKQNVQIVITPIQQQMHQTGWCSSHM